MEIKSSEQKQSKEEITNIATIGKIHVKFVNEFKPTGKKIVELNELIADLD